MTRIQFDAPITRETGLSVQGKPLILELYPGYMTLRRKRDRFAVAISYRAAWELGCKLVAREKLAAAKEKRTKSLTPHRSKTKI